MKESHHTQHEAGLPDGPLLDLRRAELLFHWFLFGIGAGMILFAWLASWLPSMVP